MAHNRFLTSLSALAAMAGWALSSEGASGPAGGPRSCATFLMTRDDAVLVGHNLDDAANETPGMLIVNKRGIPKQSVSYRDLNSFSGRDKAVKRLTWVSKHGSITYNVFGREFPDGGMNEVGLHVGEMTLLGSVYPSDPSLVKMYHHAWMQYLLDSFESVPEVLDSLAKVVPDGHCQWHFFVADRAGRSAVVEFEEGKTLTYAAATLPVRVSTNYTYPSCLKRLAEFEGFGGTAPVDYGEKEKDRRFVWAAAMLRQAEADPAAPAHEQAFKILEQMWCGANRWSLVLDPRQMRVWFTTDHNRKLRWVDFAAHDFACATPVLALDIQKDLGGDVSRSFVPFTDEMNIAFVKRFFSGLDVGLLGNVFWKGRMVKHLNAYQQRCACPR
ncbi:MAG: linear amide C-N hydrolase [Thermoanaerobaculaceae bacterium]|nr:linear amide C-N hydrolase [Thermoanaerobaculaceae bacterium]MDI9623190.1 linear amide C-N hydrolase [Acidobacteriota bacterium]NLH10745.1 linear amide C-N hydrolase [Holophagae bacterium]HPW56703.1 linear amide C-N hydrolase [Thermoanaerobaculaceae bacterium]